MGKRVSMFKDFRSFCSAQTRFVIFGFACAGREVLQIYFVDNFLIVRMRKFGIFLRSRIFFVATCMITACGFRAVFRASCVVIGNVVGKLMPKNRRIIFNITIFAIASICSVSLLCASRGGYISSIMVLVFGSAVRRGIFGRIVVLFRAIA